MCLKEPIKNAKRFSEFNESSFYDWREMKTRGRIEKLYNLNPDSQENQVDDLFPTRAESINMTKLPNQWICKIYCKKPLFIIFLALSKLNSASSFAKTALKITDILQGGLQTCFFYAALASVLNLPNGEEILRNAIPYYNEVKFLLL